MLGNNKWEIDGVLPQVEVPLKSPLTSSLLIRDERPSAQMMKK